MNYFMEICSRTQIHVQFTNYKVQFQKKFRYTTEYQRSIVSFKILSLETRVSLKGNGSSCTWKRQFLYRETGVSHKGNGSFLEGPFWRKRRETRITVKGKCCTP